MAKERRDPLEPVEALPEVLSRRPGPKPKRDRAWDAKRSKATYDLPPALIARIKAIADELAAEHQGAKVRVSDVARLLLEAGLDAYEAGELQTELQPSAYRLFFNDAGD